MSSWAKHLFKDEIVEDRKDLQRLNARAEQLLQLELDDEGRSLSNAKDVKPLAPRKEEKIFDSSDLELDTPTQHSDGLPSDSSAPKPIKQLVARRIEVESTPITKTIARKPFVSSAAAAAAASAAKQGQTASKKIKRKTDGEFESESQSSFGGWVAGLLLVGAVGASGYYLFGKWKQETREPASDGAANASVQSDSSDKAKKTMTQAKAVSGKIALKLNVIPGADGAKILLNDKPVDSSLVVQISADSPLEIYVEKRGFKPYRKEFVVRSSELGELREWITDVALEPLHFGLLTVKSVPSSEASIYLIDPSTRTIASDHKPVAVLKTPVEDYKFPLGSYEVHLENKVLGMSKVLTVSVEENRIATINERLDVLKK